MIQSNNIANNYYAPNAELWQGRRDASPNEYFFQMVTCVSLNDNPPLSTHKHSYGLLGFCSDEGIRRNFGRVGAYQGPFALRHKLATLALPEYLKNVAIVDFGNICCTDQNLEHAQRNLAEKVHTLLVHQIKPILLGGGHEIAWGHYQGLRKYDGKEPIGIINIDAHFDLRGNINQLQSTSGTSFYQIANHHIKNALPFSYFCMGIQPSANSRELFDRANKLSTQYILAEDFHEKNLPSILKQVQSFMDKHSHIYLSICLDAFAQHFAPGVSAPQPLGLTPQLVIPILKLIGQSKKLLSFDIAELSPVFDMDNRTATLGALLIYELIKATFMEI